MSHYENASLVASAIMAVFGIPWLLMVSPAVLQGFGGDWSAGVLLIEQGLHLGGVIVGAMIFLVLVVGAMLE